ncbi:hypothetical protein [Runella salmonicolor]|uniref:Uncharacterized protein n=1 Tax=Runella salmonicolor TaxID=2950278 RepID=A0ABT1FPL4_9BACT|nr:hypothetical protein [Runella salmonicolor]MCP1383682.1 hypothetical protein [Runella salmonicolor]
MTHFAAVLDISTFAWNQEDFNKNKHYYYHLISLAPTVYKQVKDNRVPILLRKQLYYLLMSDFPYCSINEINPDYSTLTLSFLASTDWFPYEDGDASTVSISPNIVKDYFSDDLKHESYSQILHLCVNEATGYKFIAYNYFHNHAENLRITKQTKPVEIDSLWYQSEDDVVQFFEKYQIKFKHNPKHDQYKAGGKVSPLSCYNEREGDTTKAQNLLRTSYLLDNDYYNFDAENRVYVRFVDSNDGTYHGFDVSDEGGNIPNKIKNKFNKNGRKF